MPIFMLWLSLAQQPTPAKLFPYEPPPCRARVCIQPVTVPPRPVMAAPRGVRR